MENAEKTRLLVSEHYRVFSQTIFHFTAEKTEFEIIPFNAASEVRAAPAEMEVLPKLIVCTPALNAGFHWVLAPEYGLLWEVAPGQKPGPRWLRQLKLLENDKALPPELVSQAAHAVSEIR